MHTANFSAVLVNLVNLPFLCTVSGRNATVIHKLCRQIDLRSFQMIKSKCYILSILFFYQRRVLLVNCGINAEYFCRYLDVTVTLVSECCSSVMASGANK